MLTFKGKSIFGANVIRNGLVLHLDAASSMSYPGSGTAWGDLSGNLSNVSLVNGSSYSAANSGSIGFDGVNDYIDTLKNYQWSVSTSFSISIWFLTTTISPAQQGIIGKPPDLWEWKLGLSTNSLTFYYWNTSGIVVFGLSTTVSANVWYNTIISYDGPNRLGYMYVNGVLSSTSSTAGQSFQSRSNNTYIGYTYGNSGVSGYFNGNISQVQIYNRALSASEVSQNFNALRSRYGI